MTNVGYQIAGSGWIQKPPLGVQIEYIYPLAKGHVGYWLLNEGGGDKVYDLSGYNNHGTLNNMAFPSTVTSGWNPCIDGIGLKFDGIDDYIDCGNDPSLDITDAITIEAWIKPNDIAENQMIMCKYTNYKYDGFYLNLYYGKLCFSQGFENSVITTKSVLYPFTQDIWHHMVITKKGAAVRIYVDTIDITDDIKSHTDIGTNTADLRIGIDETDGQPFNGSIAYVHIYNRALTAQEVMQSYMYPNSIFEPATTIITVEAPYYTKHVGSNCAAQEMLGWLRI